MIVTFWLIASGLTIVILGLLLWPLLRRPTGVNAGEQEKRLSVYRQQFVELEQDHRNGVLTDEQHQIARRELERRVLEETGSAELRINMAWHIYDVDGRKYIDGLSGLFCTNLGHSFGEEVGEVAKQQLSELVYTQTLQLIGRVRMGAAADVAHDDVVRERRTARADAAGGVDDEAPSVEDQVVVAADLVHVGERDAVLTGHRAQHLLAQALLAGGER